MSRSTSVSNRRDKYPQFFCGRLTESAANTFTTVSINIPTNLLMQGGGRRTIIEVLKVEIWPVGDDGATGSYTDVSFSIGSAPTALITARDPRCFSWFNRGQILTTSGVVSFNYPLVDNKQTSDGYGYLIAGDRFHVSVIGTSQTSATTLDWRVHYREVAVSVTEYVGIVQQQSQQ
jgi:hypothetical protein